MFQSNAKKLTSARNQFLREVREFRKKLSKQPLFQHHRDFSIKKKKEIIQELNNSGLNEGLFSLAILGSYFYETANERSDIDGAAIIVIPNTDVYNVGGRIEGAMKRQRLDPNISVISPETDLNLSTPFSNDVRLDFLVFGEYLIGKYDENAIANLIPPDESVYLESQLSLIKMSLIREIHPGGTKYETYMNRLSQGIRGERE